MPCKRKKGSGDEPVSVLNGWVKYHGENGYGGIEMGRYSEVSPTAAISHPPEDLCVAEQKVFKAVASGQARPYDVNGIAEICHLSEFQVNAALQLLSVKNLIKE